MLCNEMKFPWLLTTLHMEIAQNIQTTSTLGMELEMSGNNSIHLVSLVSI